MSRLPAVSRDSLAPEGQEVWDRVATSRGAVSGPHSILIRVPALSEHVRALGDYFRAGGALPQDDAELAILAAVREAGAHYAWNRHELRGRELGTRPEAIEIVRAHGASDGLTEVPLGCAEVSECGTGPPQQPPYARRRDGSEHRGECSPSSGEPQARCRPRRQPRAAPPEVADQRVAPTERVRRGRRLQAPQGPHPPLETLMVAL